MVKRLAPWQSALIGKRISHGICNNLDQGERRACLVSERGECVSAPEIKASAELVSPRQLTFERFQERITQIEQARGVKSRWRLRHHYQQRRA